MHHRKVLYPELTMAGRRHGPLDGLVAAALTMATIHCGGSPTSIDAPAGGAGGIQSGNAHDAAADRSASAGETGLPGGAVFDGAEAEDGAPPFMDAGERAQPEPDSGDSGPPGPDLGDGGVSPASLEALQRRYLDLRFGMFLHFGILTFCGSLPGDPCPGAWAQANLAIANFNPSGLYAPSQWADAAVSAHIAFGVLTTRHHDGFALWPSAAGTFNVKSIPWKNGQGDVVRDYVDAFRSRGLLPGLYYSIWDNTEGIGNGPITAAQMDYITTQITELLTHYGPIPILVIDGWSWKMGHNAVAYQRIRDLVKSLQPNCLLTDHTHLVDPWEVDVVNFEEPTGSFAPPGNAYAAEQDNKINASGGNDWFWAPNVGNLLSLSSIVDGHLKLLEPRYTNFILNCPPNRDGLLDSTMVARLAEVGAAWSPNLARVPFSASVKLIEHPYTPIAATATSGTAASAIDGINDTTVHTQWQTTGPLPQSVTLDLGQVYPDVGMLAYLPPYSLAAGGAGLAAGAITDYGVLTSVDNLTYTEAAAGTWPANGKMNSATFGPVPARYVRLEARAAMGGGVAIATDITVGANR